MAEKEPKDTQQKLVIEKISPVLIEDEMKRSYIDYAMSVIVGRALPDVRTVSNQFTAASCTQ